VYLGDYLARDLDEGRLTQEQAQQAVDALWRLMVARKTVYHGRVVIGGMGRRNEANADRFARMAMEASRRVKDIEPQLTLRLYRGMDPSLIDQGLGVIGDGATYPMLYNDDVNVPAVAHAFGIPREAAEQYVPFGCGEYIVDHRGFGSPNGVINLLKALEITLFNGREIVKDQPMGLALGAFGDYPDFDAFYAAYKKQLTHYVEVLAEAEAEILRGTARQAPFLFMSLLYDGCVERGKGLLSGGIDYLGATLESYGNINAVDSLAAIREVVFERGQIAPERLLAALRANFEGYEDERALLLAAPKYGNDDPRVDGLARDLHDFEARLIRDQAARVGLHSFLMVVINNSANTFLGRWTGASADGRLARTFMANANNPVGGMDHKGVTAMLNSLAHFPPENHAGVVQNLKLGRELFQRAPEKARALVDGFFDQGGTQLMISVLGRGDLEAAIREPEKHRNLLVRVGGFSARFVTLEKDVQQEVLARTLY
jgi:pyruvate-formate lyase